MNWWRRFVLFLAEKELAELRLLVFRLGVDHGLALEACKRLAFAEGEAAGVKRLNDEIEKVIAERTGGCGDYIQTEDLAQAKKGMVH